MGGADTKVALILAVLAIGALGGCDFFDDMTRATTQERAVAAGDPSLCDDASYPEVCRTAVRKSMAETCGGQDDPCCQSGDACRGHLRCHDGICVRCGMENDPCCRGEGGAFCNGYHRCADGVCVSCGTRGLPCSEAEPCCDEFTCTGGTCIADGKCGVVHEPCCEGSVACIHQSLVECRDGTCQFKSDKAEEEYRDTMRGSEGLGRLDCDEKIYGSLCGSRG